MRSPIRRLLTDFQPLWLALALVMTGVTLLTDGVWLARPTTMYFMGAWLLSFGGGVMFQAKVPVWRLLPVSRLQIARARWWAWLGLPLACLLILMLAPLAVLQLLGRPHAGLPDVLALLGGQYLVCTLAGAVFLAAGPVKERFGARAAMTLVLVIAGVAIAMIVYRPAATAQTRPWLTGAGLLALATATAAYALTGWLGAQPSKSNAAPARGPAPSAPDVPARGWTGWAALLPSLLPTTAVSACAFVAAYLIAGRLVPHSDPAVFILIFGLSIFSILASLIPYSIRALRCLPISGLRLTLILQGAGAALAVVAIGLLAIAFRLTDRDTTDLPPYLLILLMLGSLRLPLDLRFGAQTGVIAPLVLIASWPLLLRLATPRIAAVTLGVTALAWAWTYWELSRGRRAYRPRAAAAARWRTAPT